MPFVVMYSKWIETECGWGGNAPVAVCDHCGQKITNASNAVYVYKGELLAKEGATTPMLIAHKGPCQEAVAKEIGTYLPHGSWNEVNVFLGLLIDNTEAKPRSFIQAEAIAEETQND